jgi:hypothetical protein
MAMNKLLLSSVTAVLMEATREAAKNAVALVDDAMAKALQKRASEVG